jgi:glutamyl endopeptidase
MPNPLRRSKPLPHTVRARVRHAGIVAGLTLALVGAGAGTAAAQTFETFVSSDGHGFVFTSAHGAPGGAAPYAGTGIGSPQPPGADDPTFALPAGGGSAAESVIPFDRRVPVADGTTYPARATVHIAFKKTKGADTSGCTGFFVGPDTVVTAAHCVHDRDLGGFFEVPSYRLYPGRNGASIPFACLRGVTVRARSLWTNATWMNSEDERYDYAVIKTSCSIGERVGWYGYINTQSVSQTGQTVTTQGYPGDKPFATQWLSADCADGPAPSVHCTIVGTEARQLFYRNDTYYGQSGSPVYRMAASCQPCAVAIHTSGLHAPGLHLAANHGARIDSAVTFFLNTTKSLP